VRCSVLLCVQCAAVCCSVQVEQRDGCRECLPLHILKCVVVCCSAMYCVAVCCSVLQYVAVCSVLDCVAVCKLSSETSFENV